MNITTDVLSWTAPADPGGSAITDYEYRYREIGTSAWGSWTSLGTTGTSASAARPGTGADRNKGYEHQVRAVNAQGSGPGSNTVGIGGRPAGLGALTAAQGSGVSVDLSWPAPTNTAGKDIVHYRVEWREDADGDWTGSRTADGFKEVTSGRTVTFTDADGLQPATTYNFRYLAHNGDRPSDYRPADGRAEATTAQLATVTIGVISPVTTLTELTEETIRGGQVQLDLNLSPGTWSSSVSADHFDVTGLPGIQIVSVRRDSDENDRLFFTWTYDNSDFDTDATLTFTIDPAAHAGANEITASITVAAVVEPIGVTVSTDSLDVDEGGTATYTVVLDSQPSGNVVIDIGEASGDVGAISVDKDELTFTAANWNTVQTVTVTGLSDGNAVDQSVELFNLIDQDDTEDSDYDGEIVAGVSVTVHDDDAALVVSAETLTVAEGGSADYTVKLKGQPSGNVVVSVTAGGSGDVTVNKSELTFTTGNWNAAQTVTVSAAGDADGDNDTATVANGVKDADSADEFDDAADVAVAVTVTDDDSVPAAPADLTGSAMNITTDVLSWTAPDDGGSAITDYQHRSREIGTSAWGAWSTDSPSTATTRNVTRPGTGTDANKGFEYQVRAVNAVGAGPASGSVGIGGRPVSAR